MVPSWPSSLGSCHSSFSMAMRQAEAYKRLEKIARHGMASVRKNIVVKRKDDYLAFDRYRIVKTPDGFMVFRHDSEIHEFMSSQNATAFCTLENWSRTSEAMTLMRIDEVIQRRMFDLAVAENTINNSSDQERRITAMIRAQDYILEIKALKEDANQYINLAKYIQEKELNNEVNRHSTKNRR